MTQAVSSIDRDEVDRLAEALIRDHSGLLGNQTPPSYLSNANGLELSSRIEALASTATKAGLGFQFWEVFLNSGLHNSGNKLAQHSSHDRLTVSLRVELNCDGEVLIVPHKQGIGNHRNHSSTKALLHIEEDIRELQSANRRYRSGYIGVSHYDKLYEYFRFFCLNTFIHYTIDENSFGFKANGVSHFFDKIIKKEMNPDVRKYTRDSIEIRSGTTKNVVKATRDKISEIYVQILQKNLDKLKEEDVANGVRVEDSFDEKTKSLIFLKSMTDNADDFVACILNSYRHMSLSCLRIFFNFSSNVYLPWTVSASAGPLGLSVNQEGLQPYPSAPIISLRESAGNIFQPINYPS